MTTTTASESPFKAGETYRTRDGREARVYATDGAGRYPVHGAVLTAAGWRACAWRPTGRRIENDFDDDWDIFPTPPAADDLAAARAEGRREGIEAAAEAAGLAAWYYPAEPEIDRAVAKQVMDCVAAIKALLPSPPDAKPVPKRSVTAQESALLSEALEMSSRPLPPAPERERLKGWAWLNVYPYGDSEVYKTRGAADCYPLTRLACLPIDLSKHFVGEGLEP